MKRLIIVAIALAAATANAGVVVPVGAAPNVLIPAAGSTAGANGTFFRSDITIVNLSSHDQTVLLRWLPQTGSGPAVNTITIPVRSGVRSADFVREYLGQDGLGSIIVTGVTAAGQIDPTALLYVATRIWTVQPGTEGTTSQSFPAIPLNTINTPAAALFAAGGPEQFGNFRVNVGIVNVDPTNAQTFAIQVPSSGTPPAPIIVTIGPMGMRQIPIAIDGSTAGAVTQISIQNVTASATRSNLWTAYSSVVDNVTGDAWSELAVAGTTGP